MALPVDVRDVMKSGNRFLEERSQPVQLAVLIELDAADALIDTVRAELRPTTAAASLQIELAELGHPPVLAPGTDAVIAIAGSGTVGLREALAAPRRMHVPVVVVALGDAALESAVATALGQPTGDVIARTDPAEAVARLGAWLSDALGGKKLALAHNFAFMRRAVAEDAMKSTALQNAIIGTVTPIPGADMPLMTANQIKMLLQMAAAYGQPINAERVKELAAVVAGGYLLRTLARQALVVVPVLGWAVKGGVAYTGTIAMGKAAIAYFEQGFDLAEVTASFRKLADKAAARRHRAPRQVEMPVAYTLSVEDVTVPAQQALPADATQALASAGSQPVLPGVDAEPDGIAGA